jgi:prolyl oligopeptidase
MRARLSLFALLLGSVLATGVFSMHADAQGPDPYAWLEDVHGQKPLAWVAEQNKLSLGILKADPRYQKNYDSILEVLDASDGFSLAEAKSDASYLDDDTVLYSTARDGETTSSYARIAKLWKRGAPLSAATTLYQGEVSDVGISPATFHTKQGNVGLVIRSVTFFETDYFRVENGKSIKLPLPRSADLKGVFDGAYLATLREAYTSDGVTIPKGALVAFREGATPQIIFAPNARQSIESVATGRDKVYAAITGNVIGQIHVFTTNGKGWSDKVLALPGNGSADIVSTNDFGPEAMFSFQNYLTPTTLFFDSGNDVPKPIKSLPARFDASGLVTEQFEAISKDGTKIPYFVTRPKNLSGPAPTVLYGYGGFEVSLTPSYSANFGRLWLSHGGIYVVANIRGGGEFGPGWHDAALKTKRQHAYDDFEAVAADLVKRGLTTPAQLGIMGGSNGGLLVSTVMVQRPELFGAVVCQVPLIDMIAYTHIGAGASWIGEYGDPKVAAERDYILTYSPYQNVKPGVKYPPVFFVTATSDDRVTPVHARKMAAKMEAQGHEVLFYENTDGGHAAAADHRQAAEMWGLSFVYLAQKLGLKS